MAERNADEWDELAVEGRRILQRVAREQSWITYQALNQQLAEDSGLATFNLNSEAGRNDISHLLVLIHERDWEEGTGMLTSLVILKEKRFPGKGFFTLARDKDLYDPTTESGEDFWSRQVRLVHEAHRRER
jgi:hypothetical protein